MAEKVTIFDHVLRKSTYIGSLIAVFFLGVALTAVAALVLFVLPFFDTQARLARLETNQLINRNYTALVDAMALSGRAANLISGSPVPGHMVDTVTVTDTLYLDSEEAEGER